MLVIVRMSIVVWRMLETTDWSLDQEQEPSCRPVSLFCPSLCWQSDLSTYIQDYSENSVMELLNVDMNIRPFWGPEVDFGSGLKHSQNLCWFFVFLLQKNLVLDLVYFKEWNTEILRKTNIRDIYLYIGMSNFRWMVTFLLAFFFFRRKRYM